MADPIGCEAQGPANPDGYLGVALTGTEQRAGITLVDKVTWLRDGVPDGLSVPGYEARLMLWNEAVARDADKLAAQARESAALAKRRRDD